ncbi:MAG: ATP-binding protein [Deltaproteobacteria bacterium]|nr:ATP-binding protein [Deltaproteobacteria bacterium]
MLVKTLPARMESLRELLAFISEYAEKAGLAKEDLNRVQLVAEEALVNVFNYAYRPPQVGQVEVRMTGKAGPVLEVEIRDLGTPFDPLSMGEPDLEVDIPERKIGGMGVFLIRKMADGVRYRTEAGANVLKLTFLNRQQAG